MFVRDKKPKHQRASQFSKDKDMFIQPKLAIGKPGDKYEVEADSMADKVVGKQNNDSGILQKKTGDEEIQKKTLAAEVTPFIQKKEAKKEEEPVQKMEEEEAVQSKEDEEVQSKKEEEIQSKATKIKPVNQTKTFESKLRKGKDGQELGHKVRNEMETGFGSDFSHVRIHNDSEAAKMSASIGAQAFTHGNDIYFNKGKFNPNSKGGKILLAHELTHTIQQTGMIQRQSSESGGFDSTIAIKHRYLKSREFQVDNGNVTLTSNAQWDRGVEHCGSADYSVILHEKGMIYDSSYTEERFSVENSNTATWNNLPSGTYYITFHVPSTNPNCVLQGDVSVRT